MKSQLRQLYERYQADGFPSRLQIKLDMEALLAEENKRHPRVTTMPCNPCMGTACKKCGGLGYTITTRP